MSKGILREDLEKLKEDYYKKIKIYYKKLELYRTKGVKPEAQCCRKFYVYRESYRDICELLGKIDKEALNEK